MPVWSIDLSLYVMRPPPPESSMTALASSLYRLTARTSFGVIRGLLRTLSNSSSLRVMGYCWMLNESAPAWFRMACFTDAFSPWISDTTAMIEVTATMLPSTVMSDRSFDDQMASSAIIADSKNLFIEGQVGRVGQVRLVGFPTRPTRPTRPISVSCCYPPSQGRRPPCPAPSC